MLQVSRALYLECAEIRKKVCYAFFDTYISKEEAIKLLPTEGVPQFFVDEAVQMKEAAFFEAGLDGPAKMKDPGAKEPGGMDAEMEELDNEPDNDGDGAQRDDKHPETCTEEEHRDTCTGEILLGLDEASAEDPISQIQVMQRLLQSLNDAGNKLLKKTTPSAR